MKKITILLLLFVGIFVTSCDDYLDVEPANVRAIDNIEDIKGILGGYLLTVSEPQQGMNPGGSSSYSWYKEIGDIGFFPNGDVARMFYYSENSLDHITYLDSRTGQNLQSNFLKGMEWKWTAIHKEIWDMAYGCIGLMNRILSEVTLLDEESSDLQQQITGEAKVIRCWHAFKLLQYFAPYNNDELGIPLNFDADDLVSLVNSRKTQTEVYEIIINELNEVLAYTAPTKESYNIFYRKNVIHATLAQIYQYKAEGPAQADNDWENARTHAIAAMEGKYLATTSEEMITIFKSTQKKVDYDNPHTLITFFTGAKKFEMEYTPLNSRNQWGYPKYHSRNPFYYAGFSLHPELLALYAEGDIRMEEGVYVYDYIYNDNYKWLNTSSSVQEIYPMFRIADLHLIVAESYLREGVEATAKQWLDEFKAARNAMAYTSTDLLTEILNERRKEFMTEFDYIWLDMKRNGLSTTHVFVDPTEGEKTINLESNDYRFAFFIPIDSELSSNPNLEQNPDWEN